MSCLYSPQSIDMDSSCCNSELRKKVLLTSEARALLYKSLLMFKVSTSFSFWSFLALTYIYMFKALTGLCIVSIKHFQVY